MKCLTNIVGVTKDDCVCLTAGLDSEMIARLGKSTSGLYLDDLPGGITLRALDYMDSCNNMAEMSFRALESAALKLESDIAVVINDKYNKVASNFNGMIGQMSYSGTMNTERRWQGMIFRTANNSDAVMTVSRVMLVANETGIVNFKIIKASPGMAMGEEVFSGNINAVAHNYSSFDFTNPLVMPLSDNGKQLDYFFLWDTSTVPGIQPKDNKIDCGCSAAQTQTILSYLKPMGVELSSITNLQDGKVDNFTHGILVDAVIKCNNAELVCREYDENEAIAVVLSYAIWYKAGELLIEDVQKSPEVNRFTTMNREYLWGKRNHFRAEYDSRISYLSASLDLNSSSCFICKQDGLFKATIMATDYQEPVNITYESYSVPGILATQRRQ